MDYRILFEFLPSPYLILNPDDIYTILDANNAYLEVTMTRRDEIVGRGLFEVFTDNPNNPAATGVRNLASSLRTVLATKRPHRMAIQKYDVRRPESMGGGFQERFWSPVNTPVCDPGSGRVVHIIHRVEDVTEYVQARHREQQFAKDKVKLELKATELEAEVFNHERATKEAEFEHERKLAQQAEANQKRLRDFIDTVCHEIRNPLQGIMGSTEMIRDVCGRLTEHCTRVEDPGPDPDPDPELRACLADLREALDAQDECVQHQLDVANQVLDFTRLDEGRQKLLCEDFVLQDALQEVLTMADLQRRGKPLMILRSFEEPSNLSVKGDKTRLKQVVLNIMSNAVKYAPPNSKVRLQVHLSETNESMVPFEIAVQDEGPGFAEEETRELFVKFGQMTRGKQPRYDSSGLGLWISKQLVDLMGGTLRLESEKGRGSRFVLNFCWPLGESPKDVDTDGSKTRTAAATATPTTAAAATTRAPKVLLADDNAINQKILFRFFMHCGCECQQAWDGVQAVENFKTFRPDLVLMDLEMPERGGLDAAKDIRSYEQSHDLCHTPIYALSGYPAESYADQCLAAGMDGFLNKPLKLSDVAGIVERLNVQSS